eukprot:6195777-Pleurochrysis_carterae.AAC.2
MERGFQLCNWACACPVLTKLSSCLSLPGPIQGMVLLVVASATASERPKRRARKGNQKGERGREIETERGRGRGRREERGRETDTQRANEKAQSSTDAAHSRLGSASRSVGRHDRRVG